MSTSNAATAPRTRAPLRVSTSVSHSGVTCSRRVVTGSGIGAAGRTRRARALAMRSRRVEGGSQEFRSRLALLQPHLEGDQAAHAGRVHWRVRQLEHRVILTASRPDLCRDLASIGAVENTPHKEVIAVVFESMLDRGGHEKKVA